jgi:hypothetical protein
MNWSELTQKKMWAPFVPRKSDELDVSNFRDECTHTIPADLRVTRYSYYHHQSVVVNM